MNPGSGCGGGAAASFGDNAGFGNENRYRGNECEKGGGGIAPDDGSSVDDNGFVTIQGG